MDFCWVTIHVRNMEKSLHFYQNILGLPLSRRFSSRDIFEIAMLGKEGMPKIELLCRNDDLLEGTARGMTMGIEVESLQDALELMKNNQVQIMGEPISPNPFMRFCFVQDPDGYTIQLVENIRKN